MAKKQNKIIFWGTPEFAAIILDALITSKFKPVAVVTAPDKPVGRKQILTPCPVKKLSLEHDIAILQPQSLKNNQDIINHLSTMNPDIFILAAYGLILPKETLDIPQQGCLNIHPSLLPKYRGASPIQAAILNRDKTTGVTIIKMDEKVDHGPILAQQELEMTPKVSSRATERSEGSHTNVSHQITYPELSGQLAELGGELLIKTLPKWLNNKITPKTQNHSKASFTKKITKQDGKIIWNRSAQYIEAMTRAYYPWPGAFASLKIKNDTKCHPEDISPRDLMIHQKCRSVRLPRSPVPTVSELRSLAMTTSCQSKIKNKVLKIINVKVLNINHDKEPGTIFLTSNKKLAVACGKNALSLEKIQLEGKKIMSGKDLLNGYPDIINAILV